jgi:gliding motility-associated-like protein
LPNGSIVNSSGIYNTKYISHNGCDSTIQTQLTLLSNSSSNQTIIICEGDSAKLPNGNYVFYDGNYFTNLINHVNCDSTINTVINVMPQFKTNLNPDTSICSDKILLLNVNPNNLVGGNFSWNLGINKPIYEISTSGLFIVTATFPPCKSVSDSIMVTLIDCSCNVYMPNAFSPNLDNLNDRIKPIFDCYPLPIDYRFSIYNRWGQLVFTTTNLDESWDGTFKNRDQEISTFDYIITYRQNLESNKIIKKGNISMLR